MNIKQSCCVASSSSRGHALALALALAWGPTLAHADAPGGKSIGDIKADKKAPFLSWTPAQQWMLGTGSDYGYGNPSAALVLADELGDRLSQIGRASLITNCFTNANADSTSALTWALCGNDVAALDLAKLDAELVAEGISQDSRTSVMNDVKSTLASAKKVGAAVEAAAKSDPGVAAVLKLADTARAEWAAYASKNHDAILRSVALKDAARSGKSNDKGFEGCFEATQAPFAKLVRATAPKIPWDVRGDQMPGYVSYLITTPEGYITTLAYAACAYGQHEAGGSIFTAVVNQEGGGSRAGARSLTLAKAMDDSFKPKFAERALSIDGMRSNWKLGIRLPEPSFVLAIQTAGGGVVASMKPDGDVTKISFKGDTVDACLQWKETSKVAQVSPNGSVSYEKVCKKRGQIANEASAVSIPTKYIAGIAPGVQITTVHDFPVVAWKGKKVTAVLGIALK